jgi:hypothetical protein
MSTDGSWRFQLSLKGGEPMLNVRADTIEDFIAALARLEEHREPILLAIASYAPPRPERPAPAATPGQAQARPQKATSGVDGAYRLPSPLAQEIGPVGINGVDVASTKRDGSPMKSPKYTVNFSNGKKFSTFDSLVADAARELQGGLCYYTTVQNGDYVNLGMVRSA